MLKERDRAKQHIMLVGKGEINAYKDTWLTTIVNQASLDLKIHNLFTSNDLPNEHRIKIHSGSATFNEIINQGIRVTSETDHCIWSMTSRAEF